MPFNVSFLVITLRVPQNQAAPSGQQTDGERRAIADDYLLSKLPPGGREVPFVLPTFKASYVQPRGPRFPNLQPEPQSTYREASFGQILTVSFEIPTDECPSSREPGVGVDFKAGLVNRSSIIRLFPTSMTQQVTDRNIPPQI